MWQVTSAVFMGWSLGSNDAANVFGTAVASRMVKFWTAAILCSVFLLLGAILEGEAGIRTYQELNSSSLSLNLAFVVTCAAAFTVMLMSLWGLPASSSQAVVGAMILIGALRSTLDLSSLSKVVACWVATPIGAALMTVVLYYTVGKALNFLAPSLFFWDRSLRWALIVAGSYGAYALGANNVANVTGAFAGPEGLSPFWAVLLGGVTMSLGVLTYSRNVMITVGKELVKLDAFTAFIAVLSEAVTIHIYAMIGVPVSTSQAIVGAVLGVGFVKGARTIRQRTLWRIVFGWLGTPAISAAAAFLLYSIFLGLKLI